MKNMFEDIKLVSNISYNYKVYVVDIFGNCLLVSNEIIIKIKLLDLLNIWKLD